MKIVIVGAGFTGLQLAKLLVNEKNDVILIDNDEETMRHTANRIDCTVITADGNSIETLEEAGIATADALVCLTSSDEVNMITCSLVDAVYPEVLKIARVRNYAYYMNTTVAHRTYANTFRGKHRPLYGIDWMIHPDVEAAEVIAAAMENGTISNVVSFDDSEMQIFRIKVEAGSPLDGRKLMELKSISSVPLLVAYVESDGKTSLPSGNTVMEAGCTLGILVAKGEVSDVLELCGSKKKALRKIAIIGAGRIGTLVAAKIIEPKKSSVIRMLSGKSYKNAQKVVIIDADPQLAKSASERFPEASVFCADATDESFLTEEGIDSFDLAICATHNHELNMVLAAYLESLGVKFSISLVNSAAFASIAQKLGVDVTVAMRDVVVDSIMSHLRGTSVKEIHTITNSEFEIIECVMTPGSKAAGKKIREIADPGKYLVLLDKHSGKAEYEIASGETKLSARDHLVLIAQSSQSRSVLEFFGNE